MTTKNPLISDIQFNDGYIDNDEVSAFLFRIQNKYSNNTEKKQLRQLYEIGLKISSRQFNRNELINILTKLIDKGSRDSIQKVREYKRKKLLDAFKKGINDGLKNIYNYR
jgi:hypothetical protein